MKLFANSFIIALLLLLWFSIGSSAKMNFLAKDRPAPCRCKRTSDKIDCPGETRCQDKQWSVCRCDESGQCVGECYDEQKNSTQLAVDVLSKIIGESITQKYLQENKQRVVHILEDLLSSEEDEVHTIKYRDRNISFSFSHSAVGQLNEVKNGLSN